MNKFHIILASLLFFSPVVAVAVPQCPTIEPSTYYYSPSKNPGSWNYSPNSNVFLLNESQLQQHHFTGDIGNYIQTTATFVPSNPTPTSVQSNGETFYLCQYNDDWLRLSKAASPQTWWTINPYDYTIN